MSGDDERELFRRHMADVVRQQTDVVPPNRPRPAPIPRQTYKDERAVLEDLADEGVDWAEHQNGDELFYYQPGVQRRTMRKLRRGGYSVAAELDLHGCTVQQARDRLSQFLARPGPQAPDLCSHYSRQGPGLTGPSTGPAQ